MAETLGAEAVDRAVEILRSGGLVGMPTETVYGLAADATNESALARLYRVKRRPAAHPVIVHLAGAEDLPAWAAEVSPAAEKLAQAFWPGPLTLVVRRAAHVPDAITGGADTVALRVPRHPLAQALLQALRAANVAHGQTVTGIAAPSANRFGKVSPTTAQHVQLDLGTDVDLVLDGGPCEVGIESTIVDVTGETPVILRPGAITAAQIEARMQVPLGATNEASPVVPGSLPAHYAPRAKARLTKRVQIIEALATNRGRRIAVLALEVSVSRLAAGLSVVEPAVPASYARNLYANLRSLDSTGADMILIEMPPDTPNWAAVLDRLRRATVEDAAAGKPARGRKSSRDSIGESDAEADTLESEDAIGGASVPPWRARGERRPGASRGAQAAPIAPIAQWPWPRTPVASTEAWPWPRGESVTAEVSARSSAQKAVVPAWPWPRGESVAQPESSASSAAGDPGAGNLSSAGEATLPAWPWPRGLQLAEELPAPWPWPCGPVVNAAPQAAPWAWPQSPVNA